MVKPWIGGLQRLGARGGVERTKTALLDKYPDDRQTAREQSGFEEADKAARDAGVALQELE